MYKNIWSRDVYAIFFESDSFPEISEGQEVPDLNPVYMTRIEIADSFWNKAKLLFIKATTSLESEKPMQESEKND